MFLLQPLVENAYRHGAADGEALAIAVTARLVAGHVHVSVADDAAGPPDGFDLDTDAGTGLRNTRSRLHGAYGDDGRLSLSRRSPRGTVAEIVIPAHAPADAPWEPAAL